MIRGIISTYYKLKFFFLSCLIRRKAKNTFTTTLLIHLVKAKSGKIFVGGLTPELEENAIR